MTSAKRRLFEHRVVELNALFAAGKLIEVLDHFAEPLTIYIDDHLVSAPNKAYLSGIVQEFATHLASKGTSDMATETIAFHESPNGFRARVQGKVKVNDVWVNSMKVEYFCRMAKEDFKIEMLVVTDLADETIKHMQTMKQATIAKGMTHD